MTMKLAVATTMTTVASACLASSSAADKAGIKLSILAPEHKMFVPGDPIVLAAELANRSGRPILDPPHTAWEMIVRDSEGNPLKKTTIIHEPTSRLRKPGERISLPRIPPGYAKVWRPSLQCLYGVEEPGTYTVSYAVHVVFLPEAEKIDPSVLEGADRVTVHSEPFQFFVSNEPVVWKCEKEKVVFRAVQRGENLVLVICDRYVLKTGAVVYAYCRDLAFLNSEAQLPELRDYGESRYAIRYLSPEGPEFALVHVIPGVFRYAFLPSMAEDDWPDWPDEETWKRLRERTRRDIIKKGKEALKSKPIPGFELMAEARREETDRGEGAWNFTLGLCCGMAIGVLVSGVAVWLLMRRKRRAA